MSEKELLQRFMNAVQAVLDNWSSGDLAGAVNRLEEVLTDARAEEDEEFYRPEKGRVPWQ